MSEGMVVLLARDFLETTLAVCGPTLFVAVAVGMLVSVFQVLTSLQDSTLAYVLRIAAVGGVLAFVGRWMLHAMASYTTKLWHDIPSLLS